MHSRPVITKAATTTSPVRSYWAGQNDAAANVLTVDVRNVHVEEFSQILSLK